MTDSPTGGPRKQGSQWYDGEAGPLVRPYAMTGGRTQSGPTAPPQGLMLVRVLYGERARG